MNKKEVKVFNEAGISKEIFARIDGKSYKKNCIIQTSELRYLKVSYYGFDKETHVGEIIVNKAISKDILNIFKELYEEKYPIEKMKLIDDYSAVDNISMADNNSSAFNFRYIDGTKTYSNHAKGMAVDINPLYNPYVRVRDNEEKVLPQNGKRYANRELQCEYYIRKNDRCYNIFLKYGFSWGGEWIDSKDYQHFEKLKSI